jgi:hypothetical protein
MSRGIDIKFVRENYGKMSDEELSRIAIQDAHGLTPEAQEVIKEEIVKRNLDIGLVAEVEAQNKKYTIEEIDNYCELIQSLPCPKTGDTSQKLNATLTAEARSYLVLTQYKKKIVVGTPQTLTKANNAAIANSALMGWWGFPWGIVRTIQAIIVNVKNRKRIGDDEVNEFLRSFVLSRIREIERYKDNKQVLMQIVSASNFN